MGRMLCDEARTGQWQWLIVVFICLPIVVCLLLPFANRVSRPERGARQMAQFKALNAAIELFNNEFEGYPPSGANDVTGVPYCGALKLTEAMMGRDLFGFHSTSVFRADGKDPDGRVPLYAVDVREPDPKNLRLRRGPYLQAENANAYRLVQIYGKGNTGPFPEDTFILCDTYGSRRPSGEMTGMPILYYRADTSRTAHDGDNPDNPENIYRYMDNQALIALGVPGEPNQVHPLSDPNCFYRNTRDTKNKKKAGPFRRGTFILISAGEDGLYGTKDDVCNFWLDLSRRR